MSFRDSPLLDRIFTAILLAMVLAAVIVLRPLI